MLENEKFDLNQVSPISYCKGCVFALLVEDNAHCKTCVSAKNYKHIDETIVELVDKNQSLKDELSSERDDLKELHQKTLDSAIDNFKLLDDRLETINKLQKAVLKYKNQVLTADSEFIDQGGENDSLKEQIDNLKKELVNMKWDKVTTKIEHDLEVSYLRIDLKSSNNMQQWYRDKWLSK